MHYFVSKINVSIPEGNNITSFADEIWRASSPYKLTGRTNQYKNTKEQANDAAMQSGGRFKGYTKLENGRYVMNTGGQKELAVGNIAIERLGRYRSYSNYIWSTSVGEKLIGYDNTVHYKTLETAMTACASSATCNGVTEEGHGKFRINTGAEPAPAPGKTAYLKGSTYSMSSGETLN